MSDLEVAVVGLTNLDVVELKDVLAKADVASIDLSVVKEPPEPGKYHDPALVMALIKIAVDNAPVVLPTLAAAIAIWIAKGKVTDRVKGKTIDISWKGIKIASYEADKFQESDGAAILTKLQKPQPPSDS